MSDTDEYRRRRRRPPAIPDIAATAGDRTITGEPDVTGLETDLIELDGRPYMTRHYVYRSEAFSIRFHHILLSDGQDLHDHPWDYTTLLLHGSYTETTEQGDHTYTAPVLLHRQAEQLHRLTIEQPVWTYVVTGPVRRKWGFATPNGWVHWQDYQSASRQW